MRKEVGMSSQTERILKLLRYIRPFSRSSSQIFLMLKEQRESSPESKKLQRVPKVSVNRALNELKARGLVVKKNEKIDSPGGGKEHLWRATYKE